MVMFGLMAMVSWRTTDFIATQAIKREDTFNTPLRSHVVYVPLHRGIHGAGRWHDGNLPLDPQGML